MKLLIATAVSAAVLCGSVMADHWSDYEDRLAKVQETIEATSFYDGQWLPKWNQYATTQLDLLITNGDMGLTESLDKAIEIVNEDYEHSWDDFWWCSGQSWGTVEGDTQFDYCKTVASPLSDSFPVDKDPDQSTTLGGLFWTDYGKV